MLPFILNNRWVKPESPEGTVLLDFIRTDQRLTGAKEGCREGDCGACMVLVGRLKHGQLHYTQNVSCLLPIAAVAHCHVVTIEGLNRQTLSPLQQFFVDEYASQCGFCTPGFIISLTAYLLNGTQMDDEEALSYVDGNLCRCTGYSSIRRALSKLNQTYGAELIDYSVPAQRIRRLIELNLLPDYFSYMEKQLQTPPRQPSGQPLTKDDGARTIVAGGTDLFVQQADDLREHKLAFMQNTRGIVIEDNRCYVDAAFNVQELQNHPQLQHHFPRMHQWFRLIASMPVRHRATVGGNIINASPIGDLSVWLLALDVTVVLQNGRRTREIPLKDFFVDYKTLAMTEDETVQLVYFDLPRENYFFHFEKVCKRTYLDIASVNGAMFLRTREERIDTIHLALGGVAPVPLYLKQTVHFLQGCPVTADTIHEALRILESEIQPISDVRGSADYKRLLAGRLLWAHLYPYYPDLVEKEVL
ncbi:MAG: 2Fe-2S iron-sulfur cluster binding domain-containing protein [Caldithrix sp.]|nr:2Fe-2S iron-sulfur cluster binding domain-containing protein [Caldithrix sp.]